MRNQKVWLDGLDVTGKINAIALTYGVETHDATTFGDTTRSSTSGLKTVEFTYEGFWDSVADEHIAGGIGANTPVTVASNATEGSVAYSFIGMQNNLSFGGNVGELMRVSAGAQSAGGNLVKGVVLTNKTAIDESGESTDQLLTAVTSTQTLYATLHVLAVDDPADTLTVTIESDATTAFSGAETTRLTFDAVSAIGGAIEQATGAITDTYWRVKYVLAGDTPSFDFVVTLGVF